MLVGNLPAVLSRFPDSLLVPIYTPGWSIVVVVVFYLPLLNYNIILQVIRINKGDRD